MAQRELLSFEIAAASAAAAVHNLCPDLAHLSQGNCLPEHKVVVQIGSIPLRFFIGKESISPKILLLKSSGPISLAK